METIPVKVKGDRSVECYKTDLGHVGEHRTYCLTITLEGSLAYSADYIRLIFGNVYSEKITDTSSTIYYYIPQWAMNSPIILFQVVGYKSGSWESVWKSDVVVFRTKRSLPVIGQMPDDVEMH